MAEIPTAVPESLPILLVDDEIIASDFVQELIHTYAGKDIPIRVAANLGEAIAEIDAVEGKFSVAIVDGTFPLGGASCASQFPGMEVVQKLRTKGLEDKRIIIFSSREEMERFATEQGLQALPKPLNDISILIDLIKKLVGDQIAKPANQ